jgi:hypothetical protein
LGLHNQLHALASKKLQPRMHDYWPAFQKLEKENQKRQSAVLNAIREGKSLALTFAASKETFPKTPQNFRCALCARSLSPLS